MGGLLELTVPAHLQGDVASLLEQMDRYHPKEPHWYLPLIGVDPARQGFELLGTIQAGSSPPLFPMLRKEA